MIEGIVGAFALMLEELGVSLNDANFLATPERATKALQELLKSESDPDRVKQRLTEIFSKSFPNEGYNSIIMATDIESVSMCPHHLLPVEYKTSLAYIPSDKGGVLGLSKLIRVVRVLSARLVLQEKLVEDIADAFTSHELHPLGVAVVVQGKHSCMRLRGVKSDSPVIMSAMRGCFKDHTETRQEFFELLKFNKRW